MDLHEVIRILEKRPGMVSMNHAISEVELFINGFLFARSDEGKLSRDEIRFRNEFSVWVGELYGCNIERSWAKIILFFEGEETTALKKFLALYGDFYSKS